jgi:MoxR-like ATPase
MPDFDLIQHQGETDPVAALQERTRRMKPFAVDFAGMAPTYVPSRELVTAVNVALSLGRPLLLTGQPGCGKTQAAWWIADKLALTDAFHEFHVKSDSRARDLLYRYDAVSWFRASQLATVESGPPDKANFLSAGPLGKAFGFQVPARARPAVVLIDEIDKAPRDFPNDLLHELDQMKFHIDETGQEVICPPEARPVVVITSNAERRLPDPFLRRCVTHRIEIASVVMDILRSRLAPFGVANQDLLSAGAAFWNRLGKAGLSRPPSIDEFWRWLALLVQAGAPAPAEISLALTQRGQSLRDLPLVATIFSTEADLRKASEFNG